MNEIKKMQESYFSTLMELSNMKEQLNFFESQQLREVSDQMTSLSTRLQGQYMDTKGLIRNINDKASGIIQGFKETGVRALNNVCEFLGIKENLIKQRDIALNNAVEIKMRRDKLDRVVGEINSALFHTRNVGRAIAGKELLPEQAKEVKLFKGLKQLYEKKQDMFIKRYKKLEYAIRQLDDLEKMASERTSVKGKLTENKAKIEDKNSERDDQPAKTLEKSEHSER